MVAESVPTEASIVDGGLEEAQTTDEFGLKQRQRCSPVEKTNHLKFPQTFAVQESN
jgi:hypothetical protein